jgi:small subunit ribosomal protein S21
VVRYGVRSFVLKQKEPTTLALQARCVRLLAVVLTFFEKRNKKTRGKKYLCSPFEAIIHFSSKNKEFSMLIIEIKDGEPIDKALKKYKKKFERSRTLKNLRKRKAFAKPSVERRAEVLKAVYKQDTYGFKND